MAYRIVITEPAKRQLGYFQGNQRAIIAAAIVQQLSHEPGRETRNRFPIARSPLAPWELRVRQFRVYYDIEDEPEQLVRVRVIGEKDGNRLLVEGKEVATHEDD